MPMGRLVSIHGIRDEIHGVAGDVDHRGTYDADRSISIADIAIGEIVVAPFGIQFGRSYRISVVGTEDEGKVVGVVGVDHVCRSGQKNQIARPSGGGNTRNIKGLGIDAP